MENSDINNRLDDMWKRVTGSPPPPARVSLPSDVKESNFETIKFLKNNFVKAEDEWRQLLSVKERNIADLSAQLEDMKAHLDDLKRRYKENRQKLINSELGTALKLEETQNIIKNHAKEVRLLKEVLERSKIEIKELNEKIDSAFLERSKLEKELRAEKEKHADTKDTLLSLENKLDESKKAVEETLGELLSERRGHSQAEKKIIELENKIKNLNSDMSSVRNNWNAERKEWRELWERERSVWETHRHEFALWEERLRNERQLWTDRIKKEEQKDIEYASRLTDLMKETSAWSEKVTRILKLYALKGIELPKVFVSSEKKSFSSGAKRGISKILAVSLAGLLFMGGLGFWIYDYRSKAHFGLLSQYPLKLKSPTGISVSKEGVWISDWEKGLILKDAKDFALLREISGKKGGVFRPQALDASDEYIWILDMAQLRFLKEESRLGNILRSVKTPGPAPQALAFDGFNLWSFDASTGLLYRHSLDPETGVEASFEIAGLKNVSSMRWRGKELWILSGNYLKRYKFQNNAFKKISFQKLKNNPVSFTVGSKNIWFINKGKSGKSYEARKYKLKLFK